MTREMPLLAEAFGYDWADLQWFTINAMKSAFIPFDERLELINDVDQARLRRADGLSDGSEQAGGRLARSTRSAAAFDHVAGTRGRAAPGRAARRPSAATVLGDDGEHHRRRRPR